MAESHGIMINGKIIYETVATEVIPPSGLPTGMTADGGLSLTGNVLTISLSIAVPKGIQPSAWFPVYDLATLFPDKKAVPAQIAGDTYADAVQTVNAGEMMINYGFGTFKWTDKVAIYPGFNRNADSWTTYSGSVLMIER